MTIIKIHMDKNQKAFQINDKEIVMENSTDMYSYHPHTHIIQYSHVRTPVWVSCREEDNNNNN